MTRFVLMTVLLAVPLAAAPAKHSLSFTKLWTHAHTTEDDLGNSRVRPQDQHHLGSRGGRGRRARGGNGTLVEHIDVTPYGLVNSVAIHNGLAAFAIEATPDRREPGVVVFYETRTRQPIGDPVTVGALPDMLTFTHDGRKLLVANEGTPNPVADAPYTLSRIRLAPSASSTSRLAPSSMPTSRTFHGSAPICAPTSVWISNPSTSRSRRSAPEPS